MQAHTLLGQHVRIVARLDQLFQGAIDAAT